MQSTSSTQTLLIDGQAYQVHVLQDNGEVLYRAVDIGRIVRLTNIRGNLKHYNSGERVDRTSACTWTMPDGLTRTAQRKMTFLTRDGVRRIICNARNPQAHSLAEHFGVAIHDNHYTAVETSLVSFLQSALHGIDMVQQHSCCGYRIDLYFPAHKVAVECDERYHQTAAQADADAAREAQLTTALGCRFVRLHPQTVGFSMAEALNQVLRALNVL